MVDDEGASTTRGFADLMNLPLASKYPTAFSETYIETQMYNMKEKNRTF